MSHSPWGSDSVLHSSGTIVDLIQAGLLPSAQLSSKIDHDYSIFLFCTRLNLMIFVNYLKTCG